MKEQTDRMVLITAPHGERYLGVVPPRYGDIKAYVADCAQKQNPIELYQVRRFHAQSNAEVTPSGKMMGVKTFAALLPIDLFSGPMSTYYVLPAAWYFPFESPEATRKIEQLIDVAERNEQANRAAEAGIIVPGRGNNE